MAKRGYTRCKVCHRTADEVGPISSRGLCRTHGKERENANLDQLKDGRGEFAQHHARRLFMGARKRLLKVEGA